MSRQRELVYSIVAAAPEHRTAEEIFDLARERMPAIARGTVYRNLGRLVEEGKLRRLEMPGSPTRYDRERRPHPHLICQRCGLVRDLTLPEGLLDGLAREQDVTLTGYDLKLFFVCPACRDTSPS